MRRKTDVFFIPAETFLAKFSPVGELNLACGAALRSLRRLRRRLQAGNADELIYERLAPVGRCPSPRSGSVRSAQAAKPNTLLRHVPPAQGCCRGAVDGSVIFCGAPIAIGGQLLPARTPPLPIPLGVPCTAVRSCAPPHGRQICTPRSRLRPSSQALLGTYKGMARSSSVAN